MNKIKLEEIIYCNYKGPTVFSLSLPLTPFLPFPHTSSSCRAERCVGKWAREKKTTVGPTSLPKGP